MWLIIIGVIAFILAFILALGLCKAAGDADKKCEEQFKKYVADKNKKGS